MKVDVAIITIRSDEYEATYARFAPDPYTDPSSKQMYGISRVQTKDRKNCTVAIGHTIRPGNDASQQFANKVTNDLDPQILIVAGTGGGVPDNDFTLGDVVVILLTLLHHIFGYLLSLLSIIMTWVV